MTKLVVKGPRRTAKVTFDAKMDQLMAFAEHLGLLMGGGWNSEKREATFWPEAHKHRCCMTLPHLARITPKVKRALVDWGWSNKLAVAWRPR